MNNPKEVVIPTRRGERTYLLSELPATVGREIAAKYPVGNIPKLGEYNVSEEAMLKLMGYVAVPLPPDGAPLRLSTRALIDNHIPDAETLLRLEYAMLEYNFSFFGNGGLSEFVQAQIKAFLPLIIRTLTDLLPPSSRRDLQP